MGVFNSLYGTNEREMELYEYKFPQFFKDNWGVKELALAIINWQF